MAASFILVGCHVRSGPRAVPDDLVCCASTALPETKSFAKLISCFQHNFFPDSRYSCSVFGALRLVLRCRLVSPAGSELSVTLAFIDYLWRLLLRCWLTVALGIVCVAKMDSMFVGEARECCGLLEIYSGCETT